MRRRPGLTITPASFVRSHSPSYRESSRSATDPAACHIKRPNGVAMLVRLGRLPTHPALLTFDLTIRPLQVQGEQVLQDLLVRERSHSEFVTTQWQRFLWRRTFGAKPQMLWVRRIWKLLQDKLLDIASIVGRKLEAVTFPAAPSRIRCIDCSTGLTTSFLGFGEDT